METLLHALIPKKVVYELGCELKQPPRLGNHPDRKRVKDFSNEHVRKFYLISESNLNDVRVIQPRDSGGYGLDAPWCDDFHHSLHTLLTSERTSYYADFGRVEDLVKSLRDGFVYSWQYSLYRRRYHGSHVFCAMNFHEEDIVFHTQLPNGSWKNIFDSSDELWGGSGSSLPGMISPGPEFTIRPLGFVLYEAYT